jgi:hypothetical protein
MRGDLCPFDHGVNPVVLEESLKGDFRMQVEMQDGFPSRIVRVGPGQYGGFFPLTLSINSLYTMNK